MAISIASLTSPPSQAAVARRLLAALALLRFPVFGWGAKSTPRALVTAFSEQLVDLWSVIGRIAAMAFISRAEGDWLTISAREWYLVERIVAARTKGNIGLVVAASASGNTINAGDLVFRADTGATFTNKTGGALVPGKTLWLEWHADEPGENGNVTFESIDGLVTSIPGVTLAGASGEGWITTQGRNEESDESLRERCYARWDTLAAGGSSPGLLWHCRQASDQVTRVSVYEATPGPGHIQIVISGPAGALSSDVVTAVSDYIKANAKIACVTFHIDSAINHEIVVAGTIKVKAAQLEAAKTYVAQALLTLQREVGFGAVVDLSNVVRVVRSAPGCTHLDLTSPAADVSLSHIECAVFIERLDWQAI